MTKDTKNKASLASFGRHLRSLRKARGLTQESQAKTSGLSPDTIRRLEHGDFSPSLDTIRKLAGGLDMELSTLFTGYELNERGTHDEVVDLLSGRSAREIEFGMGLLRSVYAEIDAMKSGEGDEE